MGANLHLVETDVMCRVCWKRRNVQLIQYLAFLIKEKKPNHIHMDMGQSMQL